MGLEMLYRNRNESRENENEITAISDATALVNLLLNKLYACGGFDFIRHGARFARSVPQKSISFEIQPPGRRRCAPAPLSASGSLSRKYSLER